MTALRMFNHAENATGNDLPRDYYRYIEKEETEETVKDGSYKVQRPFVLVTKDGTELSEAAQAFFDYVTSKDAADIISAAGAVPVAE